MHLHYYLWVYHGISGRYQPAKLLILTWRRSKLWASAFFSWQLEVDRKAIKSIESVRSRTFTERDHTWSSYMKNDKILLFRVDIRWFIIIYFHVFLMLKYDSGRKQIQLSASKAFFSSSRAATFRICWRMSKRMHKKHNNDFLQIDSN